MKLRQPTDFLILEALAEHGRNVAPNLAHHTGKSRKNINTRLPVLTDYGLVKKIGPKNKSGLYEITPRGETAIRMQDLYREVDDFEIILEEAVPNQKQQSAATD
ncbi:transcriptional regulator [Halobiforma lacisalsi AJ5]|uniref:Transcriptional regulator n=2 Tax=Natronobacterium TaxID=2256 RepID=A0A1P8LSX6_NATLA|nr:MULTISPECIES: winged helix-turn-helix domain-containing protein [Halobiforma]APW98898.1 transcriptional regulator [Halobiforma lacisalsi AJ5]SFC72360.1 Winged helix-turn-helix DNA-binding [Halobiforma haloterrestris]